MKILLCMQYCYIHSCNITERKSESKKKTVKLKVTVSLFYDTICKGFCLKSTVKYF